MDIRKGNTQFFPKVKMADSRRRLRLAALLWIMMIVISGTTAAARTARTGRSAGSGFKSGGSSTKADAAATSDAQKTVREAVPPESKTETGRWRNRDGWFCYYRNGKRLKGLCTIEKQTYLFDDKGRQLTGWRRVNGKYRFFRIQNGREGYMVTGRKVNGVRINADGTALVRPASKRKLEIMRRYQQLADSLFKPAVKKREKLVRAFKFARDKKYRLLPPVSASGRWDEKLALYFLELRGMDCTAQAAGFAYLANAIGYRKVGIRLYSHAHCEINGLLYDPGFATTVSDSKYGRYFGRTAGELDRDSFYRRCPIRYI